MLANVPLRAVPIGVRAAATMAARDVVVPMCLLGRHRELVARRIRSVYTVK
jgi:hypothetical protein